MVMRQSLGPVAAGLIIGLVAAAALARFVQALLFDVSALDPVMLTGAAAALAVVATAASVIPARRAAHIDPVIALRG
jgi:putative ABC transport system permease protein